MTETGTQTGPVSIEVNGRRHRLDIGRGPGKVELTDTLSFTLRETLGLTGTKLSCERGHAAAAK